MATQEWIFVEIIHMIYYRNHFLYRNGENLTCNTAYSDARICSIICLELFEASNLLLHRAERIDLFPAAYSRLWYYPDSLLLALDLRISSFYPIFCHMERDSHCAEPFVDPIYPTFGREQFWLKIDILKSMFDLTFAIDNSTQSFLLDSQFTCFDQIF